MPKKTTPQGRDYDVEGKLFIWHPLDDKDEVGNVDDVKIPLRLKLGAIRDLADREMDAAAMFAILERLIPGQADVLDDMDLNDFQACFAAWQAEYALLSGATLGE